MLLRSPDHLRSAMVLADLTNRALADAAGVGQSTVAGLASGYRGGCSPDVAQAIASALDVPVDRLFVPRPQRRRPLSVARSA